MKLSRRTLLAGSIVIPFADWAKTAQGAGPNLIRYAAHTAEGKDMLKSYASGVAKMMDSSTAKSSPLSWVFQWYTHCVPNNTGGPDPAAKNTAISSIYGGSSSPEKNLAGEMWDTCQSHGGQREDFFLPWHRMYVYFFERIIRKMSGNAQFTLPYWDYTATPPLHGVIPPECQKTGALFMQNRNPGVNAGQPIDKNQRLQLNNDALKETAYQQTGQTVQGFCMNLDNNLHGLVHVYMGTGTNMGQVPYAAGDAVFWMHHCNIDRIWSSWNNNGGQNPDDSDFMAQPFTFADDTGRRIEAKVSDFLKIEDLGYTYDKLLPAPPGFVPQQLSTRTSLTSTLAVTPPPQLTKATSVVLGAGSTSVALAPPTPNTTLRASLASVESTKRLYLVARDIRVSAQPGVSYDIYLKKGDKHPVGTINFFSLGHSHEGMSSEKFWSVDVTEKARSVISQAKPGDPINAVIVPSGTAVTGANVTIGSLTLITL